MVTPLLGPDGRPIRAQALSREVATPTLAGVRATHAEGIASGMTPERLASTLRRAAEGDARDYLTLAEEMEERYLHYASQVQTRRLAIEAVRPSVEAPKGVSAKVVDLVHELVEDPGFLDAAGSLTDGIAKGYSAVEMIWEYERKALRPVKFKWRDPRFFVFDRLSLTELRLAVDGSIEGEELPAAKFVRHMPRSKTGIPLRRGFARAATWAFLIQSFGLKDWAAFAEVYGMPLRVGKYHAGASEADKRTLLRAVTMIANDAAAIIPQGMDLEFHAVSGTQGDAVFGGLTEYVDKQVSKLVVGQTMTSDDGSSLGQAKIHNEVRLDILQADCRQLAATVNRDVIPWLVAFNFGPQDAIPTIEFPVAEPEDVAALTTALRGLVPLGLRVSQREVREKIGLSEPVDDDELLTPPAAAPAPGQADSEDDEDDADETPPPPRPRGRSALSAGGHVAGCRCGSCIGLARLAAEPEGTTAVDDVEALLEETLADWEEIAAPMIDPIREAIAAAKDFAGLLAALDALELDAEPLATKLAIATAIARGIGDVKD